jgi:organic radical activating enzyme
MVKKLNDIEWDKEPSGYVKHTKANRDAMQGLLNETGPGFCLAKWTQVTIHLGSGLTHSCHHPRAHKIPLEEIAADPGALHNTLFKKEQRKKMLNGERPAECDFCWRIEDNTGEVSDRTLKSLDPYSIKDHDEIAAMTGDEAPYPRYVEISFSNVCNFKCSYCGPSFSSKWVEEVNKHGPYVFKGAEHGTIAEAQIKNSEDNPYTDAFWKWLPDALPHMHTLRITGGEPVMSKHTFKLIEYMLEHPNPNMEFAINSNGCPPDKLWKRFTALANELVEKKCIKRFTLFISAESVEEQAEYSRDGLDWQLFKENLEYFLTNTTGTRVTFMAAFNLFSLPTFTDFLEYVLSLKKQYVDHGMYNWLHASGMDMTDTLNLSLSKYAITAPYTTENRSDNRIGIDIPYVRNPAFLDVALSTKELVSDFLVPAVDFMYANSADEWNGNTGFLTHEALKLKRILVDVLCACKDADNLEDSTSSNPKIAHGRSTFYQFVNKYDIRRGKTFLETFPELTEFYNVCKLEYEKLEQ